MPEVKYPIPSDLSRFVDLYKSFGIDCIVNKGNHGNIIIPKNDIRLVGGVHIILTDSNRETMTQSSKFNGYGMYTNIDFSNDGKFIRQGFWE